MTLVRAGAKFGDAAAAAMNAAMNELQKAFPQSEGPADDHSLLMDIGDRIKKIAGVMLSLNDELDEQGRTPLHHASDEGRAAVVHALMMFGADPSVGDGVQKLSPLDLAATRGHAEVVRVMVKLGADVNVYDSHGRTVLHCARGGAVADMLVEGGAKVEASKWDGTTPLRRAVRSAGLAAVGALVNRGTMSTCRLRTAQRLCTLWRRGHSNKEAPNW